MQNRKKVEEKKRRKKNLNIQIIFSFGILFFQNTIESVQRTCCFGVE